MKSMTEEDWNKRGENLFGELKRNWQFVCPRCKTIQTGQDFLDLKIPKEETIKVLGFSCIGRYTKDKGCDWTLGGFLTIHKLEIIRQDGTICPIFEFNEADNRDFMSASPIFKNNAKG